MGKSSQEVAVGTILPGFPTLEEWSQAGMFGNRNELDRDINNNRTQLLSEIRLDLGGKVQSIAHVLLETPHNLIIMLLI